MLIEATPYPVEATLIEPGEGWKVHEQENVIDRG